MGASNTKFKYQNIAERKKKYKYTGTATQQDNEQSSSKNNWGEGRRSLNKLIHLQQETIKLITFFLESEKLD
jgi:hypothetical protein